MHHRHFAALGLFIGLAGLLAEFVVAIPASLAAGRTTLGSFVFVFSFFTILTNVLVVLTYAAILSQAPALRFFARPRVRNGVAVSIAVVATVYVLVLARLWSPAGLALAADLALHYLTPFVYVAYWFAFLADGSSRVRDIAGWLVYPLAYLFYVLARGAIVAEYPYPFLDLTRHPPADVARSAATILAMFVVFSLVLIALDRLAVRWRGHRTAAAPSSLRKR